jgi:4-amino-4-deoxy-L-arabinose transferase-like glycosyltransferase
MKKAYKIIPYFLLAILLYFPIFGHLDTLVLRQYDESRLAINAFEMFKDGNFLVTHFEGNPDMWNTKPPMMIWLQVFFINLIGLGELALRLPSAFAAFFTCLALLIFSKKYVNFWFGFIAVLVMITSAGYISIHGTRTADYDALLTLFTTLFTLFIFVFFECKKSIYIYLIFLFCACSILTKGIAGLLFAPGILIYIVLQKQLVPLLKNKHFYFGLFSFLTIVLGYYLIREYNNNGYLQGIQANELGGRYLEINEGHKEEFLYYFSNLINYRFESWHLFIPCGLIIGFTSKQPNVRKITIFSSIMIITYFLIISFAQSKLEHYDLPLYPYLSIIVAVFIHHIFQLLEQSTIFKQFVSQNAAHFIFLFLLTVIPYEKIIEKTYKPKESSPEFYEISYFLKDAVKGKYNLENNYLLYDGYNSHNLFYVKLLNEKGINFNYKDWRKLSVGDVVITQQFHLKEYVKKSYNNKLLQKSGDVELYQILGLKNKDLAMPK